MAPDVLVVGAGITGAAAALALAEAGASVHVVDAYGPAAMASGWTLAGVRQSGRDRAELPLATAAVRLWPELAERLGAPTHYRRHGNLRLARTDGEVETIRRLVESQRAAGLDLTLLPTLEDVRRIAPALSDTVRAASWCPTDGHADPVATVQAFLAAAERRGVRLSQGVRVSSLAREGGRVAAASARGPLPAGNVLLACGVGVNALVEPLGASIPLTVPIVTVVRTAPLPPLLRPVLGVANADLAARQEVGGALRFTSGAAPGGTLAEVDGRPVARPTAGRLADAIERVAAVLPAVREAEVDAVWGGLLDLTPDALPVIDRVPGTDNLVVAAGFSGHGFAIGPVTGPLAADLVLGRPPGHDLAPFRFARFTGSEAPARLALHG